MSQLMMFMLMPVLLIIMVNPDLRLALGIGMDICLGPSIGYKALFPVYTIMTTSIIMVVCTTLLRHKFTDWIANGKRAYLSKHVNKKFREAQGNPQKMKKVQEMNAEIMRMSGEGMNTQIKTMMFTMIFSLILFMWLWLHVTSISIVHIVSTPWAIENGWDITGSGALIEFFSAGRRSGPFPNWIIMYSLFSLPVGQLIQAGLKYFTFKKRLERLDKGEILTMAEQEARQKEQADKERRKQIKEEKEEDIEVDDGDFDIEDEDDDLVVEDEDE
jgi:uncharacterized membrane protein (DUF106 family)